MLTKGKKPYRNDAASFVKEVEQCVRYSIGKLPDSALSSDVAKAIALAIRERLLDKHFETEANYDAADAKRLYYLSMEFLIGRLLGNNLHNLGLYDICKDACEKLGFDLEEISELEHDPALGNGGLGRLAACFLDSLATLGMPGYGYGINYEFGIFKQVMSNGFQRERPDHWLAEDSPWQIERVDEACVVPIYGRVEHGKDKDGNYNPMWLDWKILVGVPHDILVAGYGGKTVNYLRLYSARSSDEFDIGIFNAGDYLSAVRHQIESETVSKVLYPSDSADAGKELRLTQEYFFVACSIRDIVRRYLKNHTDFDVFSDKVAIQLNDTHPALAVAELMRILVDEYSLNWEKAWKITQATLGYTNHTLLPEALEKWPVSLFERLMPRHLQIIYEINHRFLEEVAARFPGDFGRLSNMSVIQEGPYPHVRMANLSIIGGHSVNGVAALHSELVKSHLVPDFYQLWPEKFNNKTNGVTQRRWLLKANPGLVQLLGKTIGQGWITDLDQLRKLEPHATDAAFQKAFMAVKRANKEQLAKVILDTNRVRVDPSTLFDIQAKRIHEYKRQLLNVMHVIHLYLSIVEDGKQLDTPRTVIFAGKAAPGYYMAKLYIKLINNLADVINNDPQVRDQLKVVFIPDYRVSLAERIMPAADLSEQISTAGMEASGTGNMKFTMNGALTIGTLDGANVEIMEEVGAENIYIFGLTAEAVQQSRSSGSYNAWDRYHSSSKVKRVMDAIGSDRFCRSEPGLFLPIFDTIMHHGDYYYHLADLEAYFASQEMVSHEFNRPQEWARKAVLNVARSGKFSSDRTIAEYARDIWNLKGYGA